MRTLLFLAGLVVLVQVTQAIQFEGSAYPIQTRSPEQAAAAAKAVKGGTSSTSGYSVKSTGPPSTSGYPVTPSGPPPKNMDDVTTPDGLIKLIERIHKEFTGTEEDPTQRPIYAASKVVSDAYKKWNKSQEGRCAPGQPEAIFTTPRGCMLELVPGRKVIHVGVPRTLLRRDVCKMTRVQCLDDNAWAKTADDLVQRLKKAFIPSAFFVPKKIFATRAVANEGFKQMYPDAGDGQDVCRTQKFPGAASAEQKMGSVLARFADKPECTKDENKPGCRVLMVTCLD
jgi:hypothetical protein